MPYPNVMNFDLCLQAKQIDAFSRVQLSTNIQFVLPYIRHERWVRWVGLVDGSETDQTKGTQCTVYIQFGGKRVRGGEQVVL